MLLHVVSLHGTAEKSRNELIKIHKNDNRKMQINFRE